MAFNKTQLPTYADFPTNKLLQQGKFSQNLDIPLKELFSYYKMASQVLREIAINNPIRIWPHHFDIAYSINLENDKLVTVGFSLGDISYQQPYCMFHPGLTPIKRRLASLNNNGFWHTQGFVAAILQSSDFYQTNTVKSSLGFIKNAIELAKKSIL